jgi:hypothetical protein
LYHLQNDKFLKKEKLETSKTQMRTKEQLIEKLVQVGFDEKRLRAEKLDEDSSTKEIARRIVTERYHHLPTDLRTTKEILSYLGFVSQTMEEESFLDFAEKKFADLPDDDRPLDNFLASPSVENEFVRVPGVRVPVMMVAQGTDLREIERMIHRKFGRTCHGPPGQPPP